MSTATITATITVRDGAIIAGQVEDSATPSRRLPPKVGMALANLRVYIRAIRQRTRGAR